MFIKKIFMFLMLLPVLTFAQYNGNRYGIGANFVYTTSAKIYLSPNSSNPVIRNSSFPLTDIINPSLKLTYRISESIILGLSTEYIRKTSKGYNLTAFAGDRTVSVQVEDGFNMIPVELSIYYVIPFSTEKFKFLMGAGVGYYLGNQIRNFAGDKVVTINRKIAFGINVSVSMDYLLTKSIGIHTSMKFRDPQFRVTSKYVKHETIYRGQKITIAQNSFDSKINVDGVTFVVGLAYYF